MKKIGWAFAVAAMLFATGCVEQIPVEDPKAVAVCDEYIQILNDPTLAPNSKAKHEAALRVAENVDFSYARNVKTILKFFPATDAHLSEDNSILVFSYPYRKDDIQFRFRLTGTTIVSGEVVEK